MQLRHGLAFQDLYAQEGLSRLDDAFLRHLAEGDAELRRRLLAARAAPEALAPKDESQLLLDLAAHAEDFIAQLFGIEKEARALAESHHALAPLYACKRLFVQRRAAKAVKPEEAEALDGDRLAASLAAHVNGPCDEEIFARHVMRWLESEADHKDALDLAARYAAWALYSNEGRAKHRAGVLFKQPRKLDYLNLVPVETEQCGGMAVLKLADSHLRRREGFALTDAGADLAHALDETHYCIYCHHQGKDSCSKGLKEKDGSFKKSPLDIPLAGCPLEEKISEMNELKSQGFSIGALAAVVIDNPMCAGTGHRICNDCMKSCIYQKQEPVNIPQAETRTLKDVLHLPYGFEIYSLLTRWNPLNLRRPLMKPDSGRRVLVAGLGPAGYTLSHYLLNDGHTVVGIDGLKIEPLPPEISGVTPQGGRVAFRPIRDVTELYEDLDKRTLAGFGGVAEYGITVRWNKNYLKIIRLLLERRERFRMHGGVRFGSSMTVEGSFALGFDHIALCMGAGKPTTLDIPNGMARGVRTASDFLMSLQLTGAAKKDSIANLQLRLPVVVIGGGLTAIDTATESLAYYPLQVEKFLTRYETLVAEQGEAETRARWSDEETEIAEEFLSHARAIREERDLAAKEGRKPRILELLNRWGGVSVAYRKRLVDAPSYRLNHEEVEKALEEGIVFRENVTPLALDLDRYGHVSALRVKGEDGERPLPARAVLIAAGTSPNTVLQREDPQTIRLDGKYFQAVDEEGRPVSPERSAKPARPQVLMHVVKEGPHAGKAISFFGDLHPSYAGNVVKAMGSAKQGYPTVTRMLERRGQ